MFGRKRKPKIGKFQMPELNDEFVNDALMNEEELRKRPDLRSLDGGKKDKPNSRKPPKATVHRDPMSSLDFNKRFLTVTLAAIGLAIALSYL